MSKPIREVVLDTETTGLSTKNGDRIIEIGCVELIDHVASGKNLQIYINPETKEVDEEAKKIHNIDNIFLKKQPFFRDKVNEFISFLSNDTLVIHNAKFDLDFINNEMNLCNRPPLKNPVIDTLTLAKKKIGSGAANLDALCKRYNISTIKRKVHGALLDSTLLAEVYLELLGGRQRDFNFFNKKNNSTNKQTFAKKARKTKVATLSNEEINEHKAFVKTIKNNIWSKHTY